MLVQIGSSATPIWAQAAKSTQPLLLVNTDSQANITIGPAGVVPGGSSDQTIPPLGSLSVPANQAWYAVADQPNGPLLQVTLGGGDWSPSPAAIALAMIDAGVPQQIAAAITGSGLSLIGDPQIVYQIGGVATTGSNLVGGTIPNQALVTPGAYDYGLTQDQADAKMVSLTGRGMAGAGQHLTVTKKFWNVSDWNTGKNNIANYASYGTKVIFCLQPVITFGLPAGSDFTTTGTAAQQAAAQADKTSLAGFLAAIKAMGFTATTAQVVLWQEPGNTNKGVSATDYGNMWKTYGPTVNAAALPAVINVNYTGRISHATDYANAALGLRGNPATGVTFAGLAMDWYTNSFMAGNYLDSTDANGDSILGIAHAQALPFGLNEIGCNPSLYGQANCTAYFSGPHGWATVMQNELQAGRAILDCIYYEGQTSATGAGDLSSPIGQDPSVTAPDFRIALYQAAFDSLTQQIVAPVIIPAGTTVTLTPAIPSPAGGLAPVNYLSYELVFGLTAGAAATNPFAQVVLTWYDLDQVARNQVPVDKVKFSVPLGASGDPNGPAVVYGSGRMRGGYMTIKITNNDTVSASLIFLQLTGTSRPGRRDAWSWNINATTSPAIPGFTLGSSVDGSLQVGRVIGQTISVATGSKSWLFGLASGQVYVRFSAVAGTTGNNAEFELQPVPTGVWSSEDLLHPFLGAAGNTEFTQTIALPRAPVLIKVTNHEPANTITIDAQVIQIETG